LRVEAQNWWRDAKSTLRQATRNLEIGEFNVSAFLSHQAAEKALKTAYIVGRAELPPRSHNLVELGQQVEAGDLLGSLADLNPHYIISRYPDAANGVPSEVYTREIAERCLCAAEEALAWVKKRFSID